MPASFLRKAILAGTVLALCHSLGAEMFFYFPFDENSAIIRDAGPRKLEGRYYPAADRNNDTPETSNPERYRIPGQKGRALRFFRNLGSAAEVSMFRLSIPREKLYLRFYIKADPIRYSSVLNCKFDSGNSGFALFFGMSEWKFIYGDGKKSHSAIFKGSHLNGRQWIPLEVIFNHGEVTMKENGKTLGTVSTAGRVVAPNWTPLAIGNYQASNRTVYAFEGGMDELIIADLPETAEKYQGKLAAQTILEQPLEAICEPVDGNEKHFGFRKTFHLLPDCAMPITFLFRHSKENSCDPELRLALPSHVRIREARIHSSSSERLITMEAGPMEIDGVHCVEYRLPKTGKNILRTGRSFGAGESFTLLLQPDSGFRSGRAFWKIQDQEWNQFELKIIPRPEGNLPDGRFYVMSYVSPRDWLCADRELLDKIGALYASVGFTGIGRTQKIYSERQERDIFLQKKYGFQLFEINMWDGPSRKRRLKSVPCALSPEGKPLENVYCPSAMIDSRELFKTYLAETRRNNSATGSRAVILDYEPWGEPARQCFCSVCLNRFQDQFHLPKEDMIPRSILGKYRMEWGKFWVQHTNSVIDFLSRVSREAFPRTEIWDYTYLFEYDTPGFEKRFYDIPKDPRMLEKKVDSSLLSLYHVDGEKLIRQVNTSRKHLRKPLRGIIFLSRSNANQGNYTAPQESHSPKQIHQKLVLLAALGMDCAGFWPGTYVDAAFLSPIGRAVREARRNESFYLDGKTADADFEVNGPAVILAHRKEKRYLATVFNFTGREITSEIRCRATGKKQSITLAPDDVKYLNF